MSGLARRWVRASPAKGGGCAPALPERWPKGRGFLGDEDEGDLDDEDLGAVAGGGGEDFQAGFGGVGDGEGEAEGVGGHDIRAHDRGFLGLTEGEGNFGTIDEQAGLDAGLEGAGEPGDGQGAGEGPVVVRGVDGDAGRAGTGAGIGVEGAGGAQGDGAQGWVESGGAGGAGEDAVTAAEGNGGPEGGGQGAGVQDPGVVGGVKPPDQVDGGVGADDGGGGGGETDPADEAGALRQGVGLDEGRIRALGAGLVATDFPGHGEAADDRNTEQEPDGASGAEGGAHVASAVLSRVLVLANPGPARR